jgi:hypothetical protein
LGGNVFGWTIDRSEAFTQGGRSTFDALLQSRPYTFAGKLLVCDTTLFSSTAGGVENLRRLWANVMQRPRRNSSPERPALAGGS